MKAIKKPAAIILAGALLTLTVFGQPVKAYTFSDDVPVGHWAYNSIEKVTNMGLMSGKTVTEFEVDAMISKFDTVRILAKLMGYKSQGATPDEETFYQYCYDTHIGTIEQYSGNLNRWMHEYDKEIAFLLELKVLIPLDLEQFVVIQDGAERFPGLMRAEVCMFFARILGVDDLARSFVPEELFLDDANIPVGVKPYIYYMRHIGLISGSDGYFYPMDAVRKSAMAVMLDIVLGKMDTPQLPGIPNNNAGSPPSNNQGGQQNASSNTYGLISGRIVEVYDSFRAVEIQNAITGDKILCPVLNNSNIVIDGAPSYFEDLRAGMDVAAAVSGSDIVELVAVNSQGNEQSGGSTYYPGNIDSSLLEMSSIEGTVVGVQESNDLPVLEVMVKLINSKSEVYTETRAFIIDPDCTITRSGRAADYWDIEEDDMVKLTISGTTVHNIGIEEKFRNIEGSILSKRAVESTGMGVITVEDEDGREHELVTTEETVVTRTEFLGIPTWRDLKAGDTVEVSAEYDKILSIAAEGGRSYADVTVARITIEAGLAELEAMDEDGDVITYQMAPSVGVDPYTLRVGQLVRLTLDSREVENILVLASAVGDGEMTGFIRYITNSSIILQDSQTTEHTTITFDYNTIIKDEYDDLLSIETLSQDMKVYITYSSIDGIPYATNIEILEY